MPLQHRLVGPNFAVEITGVDIANLSEAEAARIHELWLAHRVAVVRDQNLKDDDLIAFTSRFGPLFIHVRAQFLKRDRPEIMLISNIKEDGRNLGELGDGELEWHSDQAYAARPVHATLLYAVELPADGGATWFADTAGAYARLPEETKARIDGLRQNYSIEATVESQDIALNDHQRQAMPPVSHPLVRTHPDLRRKALFISPSHTTGIDGMEKSASDALLAELHDFATRPDFTYRHDWRPGDFVIFDNTSTMHRREAFPPDQRRLLKRTGFEFTEDRATPF